MTERTPDCRVVAAWSAFLIFIGAGAFVIGMAIHNAHANHPVPQARESSIYYCARCMSLAATGRIRSDRCLQSKPRTYSVGANDSTVCL